MNQAELEIALNFIDHTREKRTLFSNQLLENPKWIPGLLNIVALEKEAIAARASWALELASRKNINIILPYLEHFIKILPGITIESSIRPLAKICELLIKEYFDKIPNPTQKELTPKHLNQIAEISFDWLIGEHKVAPKAYSMITLFHIGKKIDWIHPELKMIISQNFKAGSAGYKSRGRKVLNQIKKLEKS